MNDAVTDVILVDAVEASRLLSISSRQLFRLSAPHGSLPVVKLGRLSRWDVNDLREFIATKKQGSKSETAA